MATKLRDMSNPSGADVEAYVQEQLSALMGLVTGGSKTFTATEYDIRCEKANSYPGKGWEYVGAVGVGIDVIIIWKMSRVLQTELGMSSIMPIVGTK